MVTADAASRPDAQSNRHPQDGSRNRRNVRLFPHNAKSGWKTTDLLTEADQSEIGVSIADVPDHSFGIPLYLGGMVEGLTRYGSTHDDPAALKLARDIVRFVMKKESKSAALLTTQSWLRLQLTRWGKSY